jgi:formylglycine-generating enzyme required for sulfatase activity
MHATSSYLTYSLPDVVYDWLTYVSGSPCKPWLSSKRQISSNMKSPAVNLVSILCLSALTAGTVVLAQNPPDLSLGTYPGLNISGSVGVVYSIEYTEDPAQPSTSGWHCLEFLQLPASPYLWIDKSAPATTKRFYRAAEFAAPTNMVFIAPGTFRMGSPDDEQGRWENEGPQTAVIISRGFWMGKYEVTQGEYQTVVGDNPSWFNGVRQTELGTNTDYGSDLTRPVEEVSWDDANNYCTRLTHQELAAGLIPANCAYRLPTEAEWEYACRAWTSTRFSFGDDPGETDQTFHAWYSQNSNGTTHPVGLKLPNPWGLCDIHGNVWEWCQDWWSDRLPGGIALDPQGPSSGPKRVIRGGSWSLGHGGQRSAFRLSYEGNWDGVVGFRTVLAPVQP